MEVGVADGRDFFWDLGMVEESVAEVRRCTQDYNVSVQYQSFKRVIASDWTKTFRLSQRDDFRLAPVRSGQTLSHAESP